MRACYYVQCTQLYLQCTVSTYLPRQRAGILNVVVFKLIIHASQAEAMRKVRLIRRPRGLSNNYIDNENDEMTTTNNNESNEKEQRRLNK
jgi:hypothetical protein